MFDALRKKIAEKTESFVEEHIKVPEHIQAERFEMCKQCDQFHSTEFCKLCGCYMPVKTWLPHSKCPVKKWTVYDIKKA